MKNKIIIFIDTYGTLNAYFANTEEDLDFAAYSYLKNLDSFGWDEKNKRT